MGALPTAFGPLTGTFTPLATGLDNTIVIKCNAVLTQVTDANGITLGWRDADFPSMPIISGAQEPCDDATDVAFTYRTGLSRTQNIAGIANVGPSHVITLCSWHPGQAMYRHNTIGTDWSQRNWAGLSFDTIGQYLPPTLLHEGMHVVGRKYNCSRLSMTRLTVPSSGHPAIRESRDVPMVKHCNIKSE